MPSARLDPRLKFLVHETVHLLGETIQRHTGETFYRKIETVRRQMVELRRAPENQKINRLRDCYKILGLLSSREKLLFVHSYALMLEVMNTCENAYRNFRLQTRRTRAPAPGDNQIIYVLTAHPTEARSPMNVKVFHDLQEILIRVLSTDFESHKNRIINQLELAWRMPISRQRKPRVEDEAEYIYSIVLQEDMIQALLDANREVASVSLRSWVGGDKDGHPGVNEDTMLRSLSLSRGHLLRFVGKKLAQFKDSLADAAPADIIKKITALEKSGSKLKSVSPGDGRRILKYRALLGDLIHDYQREFGVIHPLLLELGALGRAFPALAIPLELRESSDLVMEALKNESAVINRMVKKLSLLSKGGDPRWYVRGFIISMASTLGHMRAGMKIVGRHLGELRIPVIPLFEQGDALRKCPGLVEILLKDPALKRARKLYWDNQFEVMLGYSDSAKEMGVLQSRLLIAETIQKLDVLCRRHGAVPVFFHGSGGSVDRGGGSLEEQTAWWPRSSLKIFKATIQGEMVERSFSSPAIFKTQVERISREAAQSRDGKFRRHPALDRFAARVTACYQELIQSPEFLTIVQKATPYRYLSDLKIGSRPTKRGKAISVNSLRAIPWVLCWTQTRILLPTWWGIGTAWKNTSPAARRELEKIVREDPLLCSFVKILGFTLSKVELSIWRLYLETSGLTENQHARAFAAFNEEYRGALDFARSLAGTSRLLWFRPWLGESIRLRSPMIHPLNLLQIQILKKKKPVMVRETVAGIANGMLTTG